MQRYGHCNKNEFVGTLWQDGLSAEEIWHSVTDNECASVPLPDGGNDTDRKISANDSRMCLGMRSDRQNKK